MTRDQNDVRRKAGSETPKVVVISGPPCSGKTTIARGLHDGPLAAFSYLEMDEIRLSLWPSSHTPQDRANAYARMHELGAQALRGGAPGVILVATYQPSEQRRAVRVMADTVNRRILVCECSVTPDDAVQRFQGRSDSHAATDLSAEKVWDLAQDFRYFPGAIALDTSSLCLQTLIDIVANGVRTDTTTSDLEAWILYGNPPRANATPTQSQSTQPHQKLTPRSRRRASRNWSLRVLVFALSIAAASAAFAIFAKEAAQILIPELAPLGLPGDAADWFQICAVLAILISGLLILYEQLFETSGAKAIREVKKAGQIPRFGLREDLPSNLDLYRRYKRRIVSDQKDRLLLEGIPLWFLVRPRAHGFEVLTKKTGLVPISERLLLQRAASIGLDWSGYWEWRKTEKMEQYFDRYHEVGVRALDLQEDNESVTLTVCRGSYVSHLCTELSANLRVEGRSGFELRQLLEGDDWIQSNCVRPRKSLDLADLSGASRSYEMLVAVQVALTTADGYLILQRRSDIVQSATGGVGSSGAGSAQWKDIAGKKGTLTKTALREAREELGWVPHPSDDLRAPFLGAAFNLMWGRNPNFYCHFHTHWTLQEISSGRGGWQRLPRVLQKRPLGPTNAADSWEVAHIIPVPVSAVGPEGVLAPRFQSIVGDARHVRGLLYCLARSDKFLGIQKHFDGEGKPEEARV